MAKQKKHIKRTTKRIFTFGLTSIVLILLVGFTITNVILEIANKYQEKKNLEDKLIALQDKEKELENDVNKLKDPDYLARYAREKYFYSKDGEIIIRIPEEDSNN